MVLVEAESELKRNIFAIPGIVKWTLIITYPFIILLCVSLPDTDVFGLEGLFIQIFGTGVSPRVIAWIVIVFCLAVVVAQYIYIVKSDRDRAGKMDYHGREVTHQPFEVSHGTLETIPWYMTNKLRDNLISSDIGEHLLWADRAILQKALAPHFFTFVGLLLLSGPGVMLLITPRNGLPMAVIMFTLAMALTQFFSVFDTMYRFYVLTTHRAMIVDQRGLIWCLPMISTSHLYRNIDPDAIQTKTDVQGSGDIFYSAFKTIDGSTRKVGFQNVRNIHSIRETIIAYRRKRLLDGDNGRPTLTDLDERISSTDVTRLPILLPDEATGLSKINAYVEAKYGVQVGKKKQREASVVSDGPEDPPPGSTRLRTYTTILEEGSDAGSSSPSASLGQSASASATIPNSTSASEPPSSRGRGISQVTAASDATDALLPPEGRMSIVSEAEVPLDGVSVSTVGSSTSEAGGETSPAADDVLARPDPDELNRARMASVVPATSPDLRQQRAEALLPTGGGSSDDDRPKKKSGSKRKKKKSGSKRSARKKGGSRGSRGSRSSRRRARSKSPRPASSNPAPDRASANSPPAKAEPNIDPDVKPVNRDKPAQSFTTELAADLDNLSDYIKQISGELDLDLGSDAEL